MNTFDDLEDMASLYLDATTTERLISGAVEIDDAPPGFERVAGLINKAQGTATAGELAARAAIVRTFAAKVRSRPIVRARTKRTFAFPKFPAKVLALAAPVVLWVAVWRRGRTPCRPRPRRRCRGRCRVSASRCQKATITVKASLGRRLRIREEQRRATRVPSPDREVRRPSGSVGRGWSAFSTTTGPPTATWRRRPGAPDVSRRIVRAPPFPLWLMGLPAVPRTRRLPNATAERVSPSHRPRG